MKEDRLGCLGIVVGVAVLFFGGMKAGEFEYTLGAKEDGPIKIDDKLVMKVITAQ